MDKIAVSVIVPIYNVEKYLDACLASLERQTLKEIEVILVDDGSIDNSGKIAREYVNRNNNFLIVQRKNGGLSAARNTGLRIAKGKYVYFLDSDDYILETTLEEAYCEAEREQLDVLKFGAYTFTDGNDEKMAWGDYYKYKGDYPQVVTGVELLKHMHECGDILPSCCMILIKRTLVKKNNLLFLEGIIHEDNLFHWKLLTMSKRTKVLNKPLYCRRIRQGSITTSPQYYNKWKSFILSAVEAEKYYYEHEELKGTGVDTCYHRFVFDGISGGYLMMDRKRRHSKEAKRIHKIERKLLLKWHDCKRKEFLLYAIWPELYVLYLNGIKEFRKRYGHRRQKEG